MALLRQSWTLTRKNLLIALLRHAFTTIVRAFVLPVAFIIFLTLAKNLFNQADYDGIAQPTAVRSLSSAMASAGAGRNTIAFVNGGFGGGNIDRVIDRVATPIRKAGKTVKLLQRPEDLLETCPSSIRGVSPCYGAAVFYSSPDEGLGGIWNYTLRTDGALGFRVDTRKSSNDVEVYAIPLQHAIDFAIAALNDTVHQAALPAEVMEFPFTPITEEENRNQVRARYMNAIVNFLGPAFYVGLTGVVYHLVGFAASERESGMSPLIEAMMPNVRRWQPQAARLAAYHLAFDIIYVPGWLIMGLILTGGLFGHTNIGIGLIYHLIFGPALSSFSLLGASFFKKAQLSGISATIVSIVLAIIAQVVQRSTGAVAVLSLLFPPANYVYFLIYMARFERKQIATNLLKSAPEAAWKLPGIVLWIFLLLQIIVYPFLGALVERSLYSTASKGRKISSKDNSTEPVRLTGFTKHYRAKRSFQRLLHLKTQGKDTVIAVNDLTLTTRKGQIMVLLGANGSGKTTTLEAVAGLNDITSGTIEVDGTGGLGICPQKNVLWEDLTVEEHLGIFTRLKRARSSSTKDEIRQLISACDLDNKVAARSKTLSGGQKRKLQLGMMFTGGSHVCCVDEVSSGLDPLSRRKIWDILLRERGARTIILTTHFLDEADLLADHIAILSKGTLRAEGSAVELKHQLGGGYRVHVYHDSGRTSALKMTDIPSKVLVDQTVYMVPNSAEAARLTDHLEGLGVQDYRVSGPSIEDVFLKVAEEVSDRENLEKKGSGDIARYESIAPDKSGLEAEPENNQNVRLLSGKRIGMPRQAWVLFRKRVTILRRNYLPYCAVFFVPVVAAGLVTLFLKGYRVPGCAPADNIRSSDIRSFANSHNLDLVVGPSSKVSLDSLTRFRSTLPASSSVGTDTSSLLQSVHLIDTRQAFDDQINRNFSTITPGGLFLGDQGSAPTFAYQATRGMYDAVLTQNAFDTLLTNVSIATQIADFDIQLSADTGNTLQMITYFGLAMCAYPAFFALYPTIERLRNVRALHYSNGVRSLPLWLAYLSFDFSFVLLVSSLAIIILVTSAASLYHPGYLFCVFFLYGLASTTLAYVISIFAKSQLAAFAFCAGGQAVMFLLYFMAYLTVLTYASTENLDSYIKIVHFTVALITPSDCRGKKFISYPGDISVYGGPILYLTVQALVLFGVLLWWDSGPKMSFRKGFKAADEEEKRSQEKETSDELRRVSSTSNGLRALHLTKAFGSNVAVEDITFGVAKGEVFALLGPNGAGKSTTISMIRGELQPSTKASEIWVENTSINKHRAEARSHMGVCPQFDAMDQMTAVEHLRFYARIRGVADVEHNVQEVVRAVGLESFSGRLGAKLSGGNKRKLSLAIALMGNPTVLLLDEPSSGMDAAAKRVMWKTLASVVPNRSIVLTTHSMEEADALADRAGIMAKRMLALGTMDYLRKKHGAAYFVHLVTSTAPHTSTEEMERIRAWVMSNFAGADVEAKTYHGQMRFSVPARTTLSPEETGNAMTIEEDVIRQEQKQEQNPSKKSSISALFNLLEKHKDELGLEYYSVSQTTLDQVFLTIIGKHNIEEENHGPAKKKRAWWRRVLKVGSS